MAVSAPHEVAQRGLTVAVNYWHDMKFGHAYIYYQFLRDVAGLNCDDPDDLSDGEAAAPPG